MEKKSHKKELFNCFLSTSMKELMRRSMHSISRNTLRVVKVKMRIISSTCDLLDGCGQQGHMVYFYPLIVPD